MFKVQFVKEKETKNTIRFVEVETSGYTEIGTIYIPKETIKQHGIDPEKGFYLTIEKI